MTTMDESRGRAGDEDGSASSSQSSSSSSSFTVPKGEAYLYYRLTDFYQNNRQYLNSVSYSQLQEPLKYKQQSQLGQCDPMITLDQYPGTLVGRYYGDGVMWRRRGGLDNSGENGDSDISSADSTVLSPCGLMALSVFNDTFSLFSENPLSESASSFLVPLNESSSVIDWPGDATALFRGPSLEDKGTSTEDDGSVLYWLETAQWKKIFSQEHGGGVGVENAHFREWMRPAATSSFSKLYGRIESSFTLPLWVRIHDRYPISVYTSGTGRKFVELRWIPSGSLPAPLPDLGLGFLITAAVAALFAAAPLAAKALRWRRRSGGAPSTSVKG
eukprot:GHVS01079871.1.p1 GENE.GHVS01079871.1~~GHVS01079871.1.p1  ORF type:complete len:330 (+),score=57.60 GHVS01079871.1:115-1104(+)